MLLKTLESDKGRDLSKNIKLGSTLSNDKFTDDRFHYCVSNPPFGKPWQKDQPAVVREHSEKKLEGRFGPKLPRVSDGSMLFLLHLISKLETPENGGGRAAIILSGSPLFNGSAGQGESEIRRYLLENDFVEAIIALPTEIFFRTGIGTYIWVLSNKKPEARRDKVQLINATGLYTPIAICRQHGFHGSILDVGCHVGHVTSVLARHLANQVIGIDPIKEAIEAGLVHQGRHPRADLRYGCGDLP